jgi:copper chaperone CopZ
MKISRTIKKVALYSAGTFVLLFIILVAHIAMAKPVDNATLQISRIDFKEPLDSDRAKEIHRNLKTIPGVKNDHIDINKGIVVYFHDNRITNSEKVFNQLMAKGNYRAERFEIPAALASRQVCPVMDHNGFSYKFSRTVQKIFN